MKAAEIEFSFIQEEMFLEVPFFQRGYVWDEDNWRTLLDNLLDHNRSCFMGSIILKKHGGAEAGTKEKVMIIDGQQRLTTLSILLRACYDYLLQNTENEDWEEHQYAFMQKSLMCQENEESIAWSTKVIPSRLDADDYSAIVHGKWAERYQQAMEIIKEEGESGKDVSRILRCYRFFRSNLEIRSREEVLFLWDMLVGSGIKMLVKIDLEPQENEQAIFDAVNTTGVRLMRSDTIKNIIFQRALECAGNDPSKRQSVIHYYSKTWESTFLGDENSLEFWNSTRSVGRLVRENLEILLNCMAVIIGFNNPAEHAISDLPLLYKEYVSKLDARNIEAFLDEICYYASIYREHRVLFDGSFKYASWKKRNLSNHVFSDCDITNFDAYILKTLQENRIANGPIVPKSVHDQLHLLESYVIRHFACDIPTKHFDKECFSLIHGKTTIVDLFRKKEAELGDEAVEAAADSHYRPEVWEIPW